MSKTRDHHKQPAIGLIELASLARAVVVIDAIVKRSPVTIHTAKRVSPGKFFILFRGGVAEVEEGFDAGLEAAQGVLVDKLILPRAHPSIHDALDHIYNPGTIDSLGSFETYTAASAVLSLDSALKGTEVKLAGLHLCSGVGGKGFWVVSGPLYAIEETIDIALGSIERESIVTGEIVARPHPEAIDAYLAPWR